MSSLAKGREGDDDQESMGRREDDRGLEADNEAMDVVNVGELEVDHVWGVQVMTVGNWLESKCDLEEVMGVLVHFVV